MSEAVHDHAAEIVQALAMFTEALDAEAAATAARERACTTVLRCLGEWREDIETPRDPAFLATVRHLYWQQPAIGATLLTKAAGFSYPQEMTEAIGTAPSGILCEQCGTDIPRTSRSWKPVGTPKWPIAPLCARCDSAGRRNWDTQQRREALRQRFVDDAPVTASTKDWQVAARLVLAYPPIATGLDQELAERNGLWSAYAVAQRVSEIAGTTADPEVSVRAVDALTLVRMADEVAGWDAARTVDVVQAITDGSSAAILAGLLRLINDVMRERKRGALKIYPDDYEPPGWQTINGGM